MSTQLDLVKQQHGEAKEAEGDRLAAISGGEIDAEARARAIKVDEALRAGGLVFPSPTFYSWGTRGDWGDAAAKAREELHRMPLFPELAGRAAARVEAEERRGEIARLDSLYYGAADRLTIGAGAGLPMTPQGIAQLMGKLNAPGGAYLGHEALTGELRAPHVNHWLDQLRLKQEEDRAAWAAAYAEASLRGLRLPREPGPRSVKLLTKLGGGAGRHIYGVVGTEFPEYNMNQVLEDLISSLPPEARGTMIYDPSTTRWRAEIVLGAEFEPTVGDVYRMGMKLGSHDAGGGSYWGSDFGVRVRCKNFTKIIAKRNGGRVAHIGDIAGLKERVREMLARSKETMQVYADAVRDANTQALVDHARDGGPAEVFRALIKGGYLPGDGEREAAVSRYVRAWEAEPGYSRDAYVNAATRAAHESAWSSPWVSDAIEEKAGALLYNRLVLTQGNFPQQEVA